MDVAEEIKLAQGKYTVQKRGVSREQRGCCDMFRVKP